MNNKAVSSPWRFGWMLLGIAFLAMYIYLFFGFIAHWNYWFGGMGYLVPKMPLNLEKISMCINSLSQLVTTTSAFLLGISGCALSILNALERKPSITFAKLLGVLLSIYAVSVLTVVAFNLMYPEYGDLHMLFLWVPASLVLYLFPLWTYYSESKLPKRYSPVVISLAHFGLAFIPFGLLMFFAFPTYASRGYVIQ